MRKHLILFGVIAVVLLSSCASTRTRESLYPKMYSEHPTTIVVMPPINNTTNVEAKDLLYTSISYPLIEAGYYVVSPHLVLEMLKAESAYDAELFIDRDLQIFAQVFGADAVIFPVINTWQKEGIGIHTNLRYIVRSTVTNETLFERQCDLFLDFTRNISNDKDNKLLSGLINLAAAAIETAVTDHIVAARKCNEFIFSDLPRGKYSPDFNQDRERGAAEKDIRAVVR